MYDSGVDGLGMLAAIAVTSDELKTFAKDSSQCRRKQPGQRMWLSSLLCFWAWQSATSRVKVMDELNSELVLSEATQGYPTSGDVFFERRV